jgi:hypothetical protein
VLKTGARIVKWKRITRLSGILIWVKNGSLRGDLDIGQLVGRWRRLADYALRAIPPYVVQMGFGDSGLRPGEPIPRGDT